MASASSEIGGAAIASELTTKPNMRARAINLKNIASAPEGTLPLWEEGLAKAPRNHAGLSRSGWEQYSTESLFLPLQRSRCPPLFLSSSWAAATLDAALLGGFNLKERPSPHWPDLRFVLEPSRPLASPLIPGILMTPPRPCPFPRESTRFITWRHLPPQDWAIREWFMRSKR